MNIIQEENFEITTNADDKLYALFEYTLSRERRRNSEKDVNQLERNSFMLLNSSLSWIGTAASPLCSFYSSYLQQKCPNIKVKHISEQSSILRKLKRIGTSIKYVRPTLNLEHKLKVLAFADAPRSDKNG